MRFVFWAGIVLLCVAAALFGFQNRETVSISFIGWGFNDVSVGLLVFASVLIGITFAALVALVESATLRWELRKMRQQVKALENQLATRESPKPAPPPAPTAPPTDQTR